MLLVNRSIIYCIIVPLLLFVNTYSIAASTPPNQVKIIFTSNMNEISSEKKNGYAPIAYLLKQHREQSIPTFFFFGGGSLGPSMLSAFDRGSHIIDLLNAIEPDVMATTKRDFSFFEDELSLRSYEAAFPFVATNIIDKETNDSLNGLTPSVIAQQGAYRIGVLSTLPASAIREYNLKRINVIDKVNAVKKEAARLRKENVDLIVLLNTGIENDVISLLDDNTVDLILQKDSNALAREAQLIPDHPHYIFIHGIDEVALINLSWHGSRQQELKVNTELYKYSKLRKDRNMQVMVDQYENRLSNLLDEIIGISKTSINTQRTVVRKKESAFGNLLTDALKEYTDADIAIINGGTIRGGRTYVPNQSISRRDIISELPYRSNAILLDVTGEQLYQAIEHGLSGIDKVLGRFLQVSGLTIKYNSKNKVGSRLISLEHKGLKLNPDRHYKVAMSDYLAKAGDNFTMWENAKNLNYNRQQNILISDIVINYIRKSGIIEPTINNRIVDVSSDTSR